MSKVFVNIGLSLDGYMAPEGIDRVLDGPTATHLRYVRH